MLSDNFMLPFFQHKVWEGDGMLKFCYFTKLCLVNVNFNHPKYDYSMTLKKI